MSDWDSKQNQQWRRHLNSADRLWDMSHSPTTTRKIFWIMFGVSLVVLVGVGFMVYCVWQLVQTFK